MTDHHVPNMHTEMDHVRDMCAEVYQVVGHLAGMADVLNTADVRRVLDNLQSVADGSPLKHETVLPFDPKPPGSFY